MQKFKNIIFDYGNVIFAIDFLRTQNALSQLGISNVDEFFAHKGHNKLFDDFETGSITAADFRAGIRLAAKNDALTDQQIDDAWNSLLIGVPTEDNHLLLLELKEKYRTFLLSNNNIIHCTWIFSYLEKEFGFDNYDDYFEKAYFSQDTGMRKPNVEIFEMVLKENNLDPNETLFIDDSPQHIAGAQKAGIRTLLMTEHPNNLRHFLIGNGIL
jgi:FMN phosphatase YigB (HAD superfamily)